MREKIYKNIDLYYYNRWTRDRNAKIECKENSRSREFVHRNWMTNTMSNDNMYSDRANVSRYSPRLLRITLKYFHMEWMTHEIEFFGVVAKVEWKIISSNGENAQSSAMNTYYDCVVPSCAYVNVWFITKMGKICVCSQWSSMNYVSWCT